MSKTKTAPEAVAEAPETEKQDLCPRHARSLVVKSEDPYSVRLGCPEVGCPFTVKRMRPGLVAKLQRENDAQRFRAR